MMKTVGDFSHPQLQKNKIKREIKISGSWVMLLGLEIVFTSREKNE